ncbi:hypothetical protein BUALT_Bualt19G0053200 [Buddleja alternifolia]|uniref:Uncharacterized protein n=1 Tax=Buddleja alternifolia TaxID=168488 RepID=A0AAV6W9Q4_9LAMI|nr:hypothetical protein BUALT_Bualt19G0053200 [Buddleja alternifolia]
MAAVEVEKEEVEVIHLWCSPYSATTSLMYSFAKRDDIEVLDDPNFLRVTGAERPYREELLSKMESDGNKVVKEIIFGPGQKKYRLCKNDLRENWAVSVFDSCFVKRNNWNSLAFYSSLFVVLDKVSIVLLCFHKVSQIVIFLGHLQLIFRWESGPKPYDGMWALYCYKAAHKSTSFEQPEKYTSPFPLSLYNLLEQSLPFYNLLKRHVRQTTAKATPDLPIPTNEKLLAWVGDEILPRESAKVSVFDSIVQGSDGVWEGLRIYEGKKELSAGELEENEEYVPDTMGADFSSSNGSSSSSNPSSNSSSPSSTPVKLKSLSDVYARLFDSAKALAFSNVPIREEVTSGMSPAFDLYGCTLIVLAERKPPVYDNASGITLVTATTRRNSPNNLDSKIHHNNLLNNILAKGEGNNSHSDDAIMLDKDGYVSETNATNIFLVKKGRVATPHADYCLPGITRATVMELVVKENLVLEERRISLSEFHTADEVFTTGTMGELSPVSPFILKHYVALLVFALV